MAIDNALLRRLFEEAQGPLGLKEILRLSGLHPGQQTDLKRVLRDMLRDGALEKTGKRFHLTSVSGHGKSKNKPSAAVRAPAGKKAAAASRDTAPSGRRRSPRVADDSANTIEGVLHLHPDGYGFVHPLVADHENIFVPPQQASKALDNDKVKVRVMKQPDGRFAGEILDVVERRREFVVGLYRASGSRAWVEPNDKALPGPISVPPTQLAQDGDVVKVRLGIGAGLLGGPKGLFGEVAGSLGAPGSPGAEVLNIAYAQGFSDEFPPEVMDEADKVLPKVSEEDASQAGRRDVRDMQLVTIDGEDARDFDDAVYVESKADGGYRLVVAVADVSNYVREGQPLDAEALHRATSVYLPDRVLPMLPERLSNGICSLKPDEDRLCMIADMHLDGSGKLGEYELYPAVMKSAARCTYNEVQKVLDGVDVPHRNSFLPLFKKLEELAKVLRAMRARRGAIDFDLPEIRVELGPDGKPLRMVSRDRLFAHRIVEECMLAANEAVAKFFQDNDLPSVYRFHGDPDEEKLATFAAVANAYGFELDSEGITSRELNDFVKQLEGHAEQKALNQLLLRSMMQAVYSSQNVGHYGLAAEHYLHFTSPIRRYPDLLVHRQLKKIWSRKGKKYSEVETEREEEKLEAMAIHSSGQERAAMQVERETVNFYQTLLMKDRVGEEFAATVAGVTEFGVFVQLDTELVEGLVRAENLSASAEYDPLMHALVLGSGKKVRVGQKLTVRLIAANLERRQLEFSPIAFEGEEPLQSQKTVERSLERFRTQRSGGRDAGQRSGGGRDSGQRGGRDSGQRAGGGRDSAQRSGGGRDSGQRSGGRDSGRGEGQRRESPRREPEARGRAVRHEQREAPPKQPWEAPTGNEERSSSSPHPGFDRLRALAAKNRQGSSAGSSGGGWHDRTGSSSDRKPSRGGSSASATDTRGGGRHDERPTRGHRGGDRHGGKPKGGKPSGGGGKRRR